MKIEIVNVMKFPSADQKRLGQFDNLVSYTIDGRRRDNVLIPKDPIDSKEIERAINEEMQKRSKLIGHSFEVK